MTIRAAVLTLKDLSLPEMVAMQNAPECVKLAKRAYDTAPPGKKREAGRLYRLVVARHLNHG